MARFVYYRCPDCGGTFQHLHHPSDAPPPNRCALCRAWMSDEEPFEETFVPVAPGIRKSSYAQSVDQSYRAMEESSRHRADEAADMLDRQYREQGKPASPLEADMRREEIATIKSELKVTNMRDPSEMRAGDTAAIMPSAVAATANLSVGPSRPGFRPMQGMIYEAGQAPAPGERELVGQTMTGIRSTHSQTAARLVAAGNMGAYTKR